MKKQIAILLILIPFLCVSQNSMVGDGFGGRLWYSPTNYTAGSYSAYSICYDDSSQLYGWGSNITNQLGTGGGGVNTPIPIPNTVDVKYFSTGYNMGAIKNDSTGWVWGTFTTNPVQVINNAYFLDASSENISFVKTDGTVWTLGNNISGQYGDGTNTSASSYTTPTQMLNVNNAVRVANTHRSTVVLLGDSTLVATGNNVSGLLGLGQSVNSTNVPLPITGLPKIVDIKSNHEGTIALSANGDVYSWGVDYSSVFFPSTDYTPVLLPNLSNIVAISGCDDGFHFLALDANKNCYGWGSMGYTFGSPTTASSPSFIASDVIDIMAGETFSYIVKSDGSLWCSGHSNNGGSIWLNLPDTLFTDTFTLIDPSIVPGACLVDTSNGNSPPPPNPTNDDNYSDTIITIFPNTFSPNGDGENDELNFSNLGITEIYWKVYNRWGQLLFETNQLNQAWDGTTQAGRMCPEGTYLYLVTYKKSNSKNWERHKGFFTLFR